MIKVKGANAIAVERIRQQHKGYTVEHDTKHGASELIDAALAYAIQAQDKINERDNKGVGADPLDFWPWNAASFKTDDNALRSLAKAGALLAAAYDVEEGAK